MSVSAYYLGLAAARGAPGVRMHLRAWSIASRILRRERDPERRGLAFDLLLRPIDSVRYFELDFAWSAVRRLPRMGRVVDVSSPRLLPLAMLEARPDVEAVLVNPDRADQEMTRALAMGAGSASRCTFLSKKVDALDLPEDSVDLVTSCSVVEHMPGGDDTTAVARMWRWVRPGGSLVLTVPCSREPFEEYIDMDEYGLLAPDERGFTLGQRFYDQDLLGERFFRTCGAPRRLAVLGERRRGAFFADRDRKVLGIASWEREPWTAARTYRHFDAITQLPGIGVAAMEFFKPGATG